MRIVAAVTASFVLIAACPGLVSAADEPPALSHNPFSRPLSEVPRVERSAIESNDGSGPTIELKATMIGRANRLANVAGRILKPGDEIEGYELIEVQEEYAVFRTDGKLITVYVKPQPAEEDE
jgi:hypothetical protein